MLLLLLLMLLLMMMMAGRQTEERCNSELLWAPRDQGETWYSSSVLYQGDQVQQCIVIERPGTGMYCTGERDMVLQQCIVPGRDQVHL